MQAFLGGFRSEQEVKTTKFTSPESVVSRLEIVVRAIEQNGQQPCILDLICPSQQFIHVPIGPDKLALEEGSLG